MEAEVQLSYRLDSGSYSGDINGSPFEGVTFARMMTLVSAELRKGRVGVVLVRTERVGSLPVSLSEQQESLLREDPVTFIHQHTFPPCTVRVEAVVEPESILRVGHDTIADAFGDTVYARVEGGTVESPFTGRWESLDGCPWVSFLSPEGCPRWAGIEVSRLLSSAYDRFYLPREWNTHGCWVTKKQLARLQASYQKEVNACHL